MLILGLAHTFEFACSAIMHDLPRREASAELASMQGQLLSSIVANARVLFVCIKKKVRYHKGTCEANE